MHHDYGQKSHCPKTPKPHLTSPYLALPLHVAEIIHELFPELTSEPITIAMLMHISVPVPKDKETEAESSEQVNS